MITYYETPDGLYRYYGDFTFDEFGMPVSGIITRVIGYSEVDGTTTPAWRATNLSVEIGDHLDELENDPYLWLAQNDNASLSVYASFGTTAPFDLGDANGVQLRMDAGANGIINFGLIGGVNSNIFMNTPSHVWIEDVAETRIKIGENRSSLTVIDSDSIRILGGDGRDSIGVRLSSDVYISTGGGALPEPFTPHNETGVAGCDDFRIAGSHVVDFIYINSYAEYIDGELVGTTTSSNGVAYGGGADDSIFLENGENIRAYGGEGSDDFLIDEGTYNISGGADADRFLFTRDAGDYDVRIKDFNVDEDCVAFDYDISYETITAQQAFDLFMENAFERGANVVTTIDGNRIILHDTSLDDLSVDNFCDTFIPRGVDG
ncbi:hypothetical protein GCM10008927_06780 [Amylibacter ulvae]|uniref:Uncharacterized protein n=1 Tax=Paramylibacter ulvae TaxID=1651968 RepID=A0ABQ3CYH0_9RHOB|nr:hypothetical protein GCM10008927_06780 [Amylibacter ulvae]